MWCVGTNGRLTFFALLKSSLLNKLTLDNYDKLSQEIKCAVINDEKVLRRVIQMLFEKAVHEKYFASVSELREHTHTN